MLDVSAALTLAATTVYLKSKNPATYDNNGNLIAGLGDPRPIQATVQPISGRALMDLPEGVRDEARKLIWTKSALETGQVVADNGQDYRVVHVWDRRIGGYYKAVLGLTN